VRTKVQRRNAAVLRMERMLHPWLRAMQRNMRRARARGRIVWTYSAPASITWSTHEVLLNEKSAHA